jgi:hypothetical protein
MTIEAMLAEISEMPVRERKRLISLIVESLPEQDETSHARKRSILEFEGVGSEIWANVNVQDYLDQLRNEWDKTP